LPLLVSGILLMPLGLLVPGSAALADDTVPDPEPSVSVSVPADPDPADPGPADPDPGDGGGAEDPGDDVLSGVFTRTPASGPAGTQIKLASKDKCVDADGVAGPTVDVLLFNLGNVDDLDDVGSLSKIAKAAEKKAADEDIDFDFTEKAVDTEKDGSWATTVSVPKTAEAGDYFVAIAGCFAEGIDPTADDAVPFLIYEPQDFSVTGAPTAPPADPKPGDPSFTG
jgi:hypothetical protein